MAEHNAAATEVADALPAEVLARARAEAAQAAAVPELPSTPTETPSERPADAGPTAADEAISKKTAKETAIAEITPQRKMEARKILEQAGRTKEFDLGLKLDRGLFQVVEQAKLNFDRMKIMQLEKGLPFEESTLQKQINHIYETLKARADAIEAAEKSKDYSKQEKKEFRIFQEEEEIILGLEAARWDAESKLIYLAHHAIPETDQTATEPTPYRQQMRFTITRTEGPGHFYRLANLVNTAMTESLPEAVQPWTQPWAQKLNAWLVRDEQEIVINFTYEPNQYAQRVATPYVEAYLRLQGREPAEVERILKTDIQNNILTEAEAYNKIGLETVTQTQMMMLNTDIIADPEVGRAPTEIAFNAGVIAEQLLGQEHPGKTLQELSPGQRFDLQWRARQRAIERVCSKTGNEVFKKERAQKTAEFDTHAGIIRAKAEARRTGKDLEARQREATRNFKAAEREYGLLESAFKRLLKIQSPAQGEASEMTVAQRKARIAKEAYQSQLASYGRAEITQTDHDQVETYNTQINEKNTSIRQETNRYENATDSNQRQNIRQDILTLVGERDEVEKKRKDLQAEIKILGDLKRVRDETTTALLDLEQERNELIQRFFPNGFEIETDADGNPVLDADDNQIITGVDWTAINEVYRQATETYQEAKVEKDKIVVAEGEAAKAVEFESPEADGLELIADFVQKAGKGEVFNLSQEHCAGFANTQIGHENFLKHLFGDDVNLELAARVLPRSEIARVAIEQLHLDPLALRTPDGRVIFANQEEVNTIGRNITTINGCQELIGKITLQGIENVTLEEIQRLDSDVAQLPESREAAIELLQKRIQDLRTQDQVRLETAFRAIQPELRKNPDRTRMVLLQLTEDLDRKGLQDDPFAPALELVIPGIPYEEQYLEERVIERLMDTIGTIEYSPGTTHPRIEWQGTLAGIEGTQMQLNIQMNSSDIEGRGQVTIQGEVVINEALMNGLPFTNAQARTLGIPTALRERLYHPGGVKKEMDEVALGETIVLHTGLGRTIRNVDNLPIVFHWYGEGAEDRLSVAFAQRVLQLSAENRRNHLISTEFRTRVFALHGQGSEGLRTANYALSLERGGELMIRGSAPDGRFAFDGPLTEFIADYKKHYMEMNDITNENELNITEVEEDLFEIYRLLGMESLRSMQRWTPAAAEEAEEAAP